MIVSLTGRKGSGKSVLADELVKQGFTKIGFADYLKSLVSCLYRLPLDSLNDPFLKEKVLKTPLLFGEEQITYIEKENDIIIHNRENKTFLTIREALQIIGTEVLRNADPDFHVKKLKDRIDPDKNYVCEDCRFPNELDLLRSLNALCIYIMRPANFIYDTHPSETALIRNDFLYVLVNDTSKKEFITSFKRIIKTYFAKKNKYTRDQIRTWLEESDYDTKIAGEKLRKSRDFFIWWARNWGIRLPEAGSFYIYNHDAFLSPNTENSYFAGLLSSDGCVKMSGVSTRRMLLELSSLDKCLIDKFKYFMNTNKPIDRYITQNGNIRYSLVISSPFIIEDMKQWCINPNKSRYNKIPDCIKENKELIGYWLVGLIDGDGCIYQSKDKDKNENPYTVSIGILASLEIIQFLSDMYPYNGKISPEKRVENLYLLRFYGKSAVELCNHLPYTIGLRRKWEKMDYFMDKIWKH